LGSLVVIHPFHPLAGQRMEILFSRRGPGGVVFTCARPAAGQVTLPADWTDRGRLPAPERLSADGLAALDTLTRSLQGR
jgi:Family of unknown function (DUF5372)